MAGGRSSRMGRNKALITVEGCPLWQRQYQVLAEAGARERWISLRSEDDWAPPEIPRVFDDGVTGPLGGILAALEACTGTHLIVLAVDLPRLPADWLRILGSGCASGRGAIGWRSEIEGYEPLAAIYPREFVSRAAHAVIQGNFSLQALIASAVVEGLFHVRTILPEQLGWFANWNTPADLAGRE